MGHPEHMRIGAEEPSALAQIQAREDNIARDAAQLEARSMRKSKLNEELRVDEKKFLDLYKTERSTLMASLDDEWRDVIAFDVNKRRRVGRLSRGFYRLQFHVQAEANRILIQQFRSEAALFNQYHSALRELATSRGLVPRLDETYARYLHEALVPDTVTDCLQHKRRLIFVSMASAFIVMLWPMVATFVQHSEQPGKFLVASSIVATLLLLGAGLGLASLAAYYHGISRMLADHDGLRLQPFDRSFGGDLIWAFIWTVLAIADCLCLAKLAPTWSIWALASAAAFLLVDPLLILPMRLHVPKALAFARLARYGHEDTALTIPPEKV